MNAIADREFLKVAATEGSRPLRIALVSPYDFAYPGGVTSHISGLSDELRRRGHDVTIVAPSSKPRDNVDADNLVVIGRPIPVPTAGSIARITLSLTLGKHVRPLLEQGDFDVVHLHEPMTPTLPLTFLRLASGPAMVGTFHAYAERRRAFGLSRFWLQRWARRLDERIAVTEPARQFANRYFPGDYTIIPNGVDTDEYANATPMPTYQDGKLNILFQGRMEKRKGFPHMLRAYAQVRWQFPNCRLLVVGPGSMDRESARVIGERGLEDVHFIGYVSNEDLPRYYRTADIFCSPALGNESMGIVLIQAMAAGRAVVASDIAGHRSVITNEHNGLLADPRDEEGFAATLIRLLRDADLRSTIANTGSETVARYHWRVVADEVLEVYGRALERRAHKIVGIESLAARGPANGS